MDIQVQKAQRWVNSTYAGVSGYMPCPETGITGWSTVYSLTRALQHELGIASLSDNFGDGTMAAVVAHGPISKSTSNLNLKKIVESALYCKGYPGGPIDGAFGVATQEGLSRWKTDMGFPASGVDNKVLPKELRTLLTMDAYVLLAGGSAAVRAIQQWMNSTYVNRSDFRLVPCDGYFSRDVQRGLMLAIQYSIGMADGVANGNFGPGTRDGIRTKGHLAVGATDGSGTRFVRLFKAALIFNKVDGVDWETPTYSSLTSDLTRKFQLFCRLPQTGVADYQTWCSLLVSTGDPERVGTAADCMIPLNDARAKMIKSAGFTTIGRYITGGTNKILTASEIAIIFSNGLRFFPIYQEYNNSLSYFDRAQGKAQGENAHASAVKLGIPTGAVVYFSVDYDATSDEVRSNIIPFFDGVNQAFKSMGGKYSVGIYGSRNICSMVSALGYAVSSFVSGMSTGFSGNLGFSLPINWSFDQVQTLTLGVGTPGEIEIDKNIMSGVDQGISSLTKPIDQNAAMVTWLVWLEARAMEWHTKGNTQFTQPQLVAHYLRTYHDDRYDGLSFDIVSGPIDHGFIDYCNSSVGRPDPATLRDPATGIPVEVQHMAASLGSALQHGRPGNLSEVNLTDFGGWAGDLITLAADTYLSGVSDDGAYSYAYGMIGNRASQGSFDGSDFVSDVDAMVFGLALRSGEIAKLSDAVVKHYAGAGAARARYASFVQMRFGGRDSFLAASRNVFYQTSDVAFSGARAYLWQNSVKLDEMPIGVALATHPKLFEGVSTALVNVLYDKFAS